MNADRHRFKSSGWARLPASRALIRGVWWLASIVWLLLSPAQAGIFRGNARLEVTDSSGGLSWNSSANAMIVQCWFKVSIPSGTNLTDNMTILVNRLTGSQSDPHAYLIQFNINTGNYILLDFGPLIQSRIEESP